MKSVGNSKFENTSNIRGFVGWMISNFLFNLMTALKWLWQILQGRYQIINNHRVLIGTGEIVHVIHVQYAYLVVEAWAIMLPPIGFLGSAWNIDAPSTWATTWFVITTATPNWPKSEFLVYILSPWNLFGYYAGEY